jgi:hypothetical protein
MGLKRDAHPHPEERACASVSTKRNARARVSKDEDGHGMALMLRDASQHSGGRSSSRPRARKSGLPDLRLLKRPISGKPEIGCDAPQHEGGPTCGCEKRPPAALHCFRIVIYNERRNSNVLNRQRAVRTGSGQRPAHGARVRALERGARHRGSFTAVSVLDCDGVRPPIFATTLLAVRCRIRMAATAD